MTNKQRAVLYHELAKLLGAGMHMDRSLDLLLDQRPARGIRTFLLGIQRGLEERLSVSDSVAKYNADLVSSMEISLLSAGEKGGRLDASCAHLARYFEMREKSRAKAVGALIYPLILLHFGLMFPDLQLIMQEGGLQSIIPQALKRLAYAWIFLGGFGALAVMILKLAGGSTLIDRLLSITPLVGSARWHWALARFCQVFHTGLLASMNMSESLRLAGEATQSALLDAASRAAAKQIKEGHAVAPSLKKTGAFPRSFANAIDTAEQTGTLDVEMARWAMAEAELASQAQDRAAEWLPRIFYVFVVLYIGYRIVSMFAGYYTQLGGMLDNI